MFLRRPYPEFFDHLALGIHVLNRVIRDVGGLGGIAESTQVVFQEGIKRCDAGDHEAITIASDALFENAREFRVPVGYEPRLAVFGGAQGGDDLPEGEQGLVDLDAFLECGALVASLRHLLAAGEVHQLQLGGENGAGFAVHGLYVEGENAVGPGRGRVGVVGRHDLVLDA